MAAHNKNCALILVDLQNDFMPNGALGVPEGDKVVPIANQLQQHFPLIVATQDWHPPDHASFASQHKQKSPGEIIVLDGLSQVLWPDHAVQNTVGAKFVDTLDTNRIAHVVQKGVEQRIDSYSGFFDNGHRNDTGLGTYLTCKGVTHVYIAGLATDYCVKFTALDARTLGFETSLIVDACRGVTLKKDDVANALAEMTTAGVRVIDSHRVLDSRDTI